MRLFSKKKNQILILLTKETLDRSETNSIKEQITTLHPTVTFAPITYQTICDEVEDLFMDHEPEMQELVRDYIEYCHETDLLDTSRQNMRVVPCGNSFELNKKHGLYFHPSHWGYTQYNYLGIYTQKAIRLFWTVDSVFDVHYENGQLTKTHIQGEETNDYDDRIIAMIADAETHCDYQIATGCRFFCTRNNLETLYRKTSRGGIQGARLHNLSQVLPKLETLSPKQIAVKLKDHTWA